MRGTTQERGRRTHRVVAAYVIPLAIVERHCLDHCCGVGSQAPNFPLTSSASAAQPDNLQVGAKSPQSTPTRRQTSQQSTSTPTASPTASSPPPRSPGCRVVSGVSIKMGLLILNGHEDEVYSISWSPDGKWLVSGSFDRTVSGLLSLPLFRRWYTCTHRPPALECISHVPRTMLVHTPYGASFFNGCTGIQVLNHLPRWRQHPDSAAVCLLMFMCSGSCVRCDLDCQRRKVACAQVRMWDPVTTKCVRVLEGHTNTVNEVKWSPDGKWIASGSDDHTVCSVASVRTNPDSSR